MMAWIVAMMSLRDVGKRAEGVSVYDKLATRMSFFEENVAQNASSNSASQREKPPPWMEM